MNYQEENGEMTLKSILLNYLIILKLENGNLMKNKKKLCLNI